MFKNLSNQSIVPFTPVSPATELGNYWNLDFHLDTRREENEDKLACGLECSRPLSLASDGKFVRIILEYEDC